MHDLDLMLQLQLEGKHEEARAISDKLESLGPDKILDPLGNNTEDIWLRHCFNRGWFLLNDGDYIKGSQSLDAGRFINVYGSPPLRTKATLYNPKEHDLTGKVIVLSLEGGLGDEIIHARFAKSFKDKGASKVYIACAEELLSILSRIEGVEDTILRSEVDDVNPDFWIPGFSAGWVAGHTFDDFPSDPYLTPKQDFVDNWKKVIDTDKIKIGIRWAGNPKFEHQQHRRFPVEFMFNLSKYEEVQLYSFQKDFPIDNLPDNVVDLDHHLSSWEETAAAVANMDIIITSCTSVAHLAAAMGKETWVMVPCLPYHTWTWKAPLSTTTPYYKSVKLFRQKKYGTWDEAFQKMYASLEQKYSLKHLDLPNCDKEPKKLNLGCGTFKVKNFVNVDINPIYNPDVVFDLNQTPWPFKDKEFTHIVAKDILEHLGSSGDDFIKIIKEMYRVSENGAIWEIQFPHWNSDHSVDDITHVRKMTFNSLKMFDMQYVHDRIVKGMSDSITAFEAGTDIQVISTKINFAPYWQKLVNEGRISEDEITYALNTYNNVAVSVMALVQVHKPGRFTMEELKQTIEKAQSKYA